MQFDAATQKMADILSEPEGKKQGPLLDGDVSTRTKIPFRVDHAIMVRSHTNPTHMARTRIIGAKHGEYVLIIEPSIKINDRISAVFDRDFLCSYLHNGFMYIFNSKYLRHLTEDLVCIEYPTKVEIRQIRRHRRIRVNIETECTLCDSVGVFFAKMADISQGGCRLILNPSAGITKGTNLSLTFSLPDEALVEGLQSVVARTGRIQDSQQADAGVSFTGPESEISKISNFCEFCMFFDTE